MLSSWISKSFPGLLALAGSALFAQVQIAASSTLLEDGIRATDVTASAGPQSLPGALLWTVAGNTPGSELRPVKGKTDTRVFVAPIISRREVFTIRVESQANPEDFAEVQVTAVPFDFMDEDQICCVVS